MTENCWKCGKLKADYVRDKLELARAKAREQAEETGETMVIIKNRCNFLVKKASEVTEEGIEYISKYS